MQCKEGMRCFRRKIGKKLKKETLANSANDRNQNCRALLPSSFIREIKEILGWVPYLRESTRSLNNFTLKPHGPKNN